MNKPITFYVDGKPVAFMRARKHGNRFFNDKKYTAYKNLVRAQCQLSNPEVAPTSSPYHIWIEVYFAMPESWPLWKRTAALEGRIAHTAKPDGDNILKSIKDALNCVVYLDDAQVVKSVVSKWWVGEDFVYVKLYKPKTAPSSVKTKAEFEAWQATR